MRGLGKRREAPDEPRISPCAGLLAIDPARRIEVLRIAHQTLDERLEPFVVAVPGHGDVSHDAPDEARRSVILVEDPVHPPAPGAAQLFENVTRRASHARVAWIHAVLHEKKVRPVGRLVLGSPEVRARPAGVGPLPAEDRRNGWHVHRALLGVAKFGITWTLVQERTQGLGADRGVAAFEKPRHWVAFQKLAPGHQAPPTDSSEMTSVGLPSPLGPKTRSVPTPTIESSRCVRLPAMVMPCTGWTRLPRSR